MISASINSRVKSDGHGRAQILALLDEVIPVFSLQDHRRLNQVPFQAGQDFFYAGFGALSVQSGLDIQGDRLTLGDFQAGIVDALNTNVLIRYPVSDDPQPMEADRAYWWSLRLVGPDSRGSFAEIVCI